jgi:hypothetical protein
VESKESSVDNFIDTFCGFFSTFIAEFTSILFGGYTISVQEKSWANMGCGNRYLEGGTDSVKHGSIADHFIITL